MKIDKIRDRVRGETWRIVHMDFRSRSGRSLVAGVLPGGSDDLECRAVTREVEPVFVCRQTAAKRPAVVRS